MDTVFDPRLGKMVDRRTGLPVGDAKPAPERVGTLGQIFNGTGIPERVTLMNELLNPMVNMRDAGTASQALFDPDTSGWGRVGAFGNMASNMAAVLAPVAAAKGAGAKPVDAVVEALTNYSAAPRAMGGEFLVDEFGGVRLPGGGIRAYHGSPHSFDRFSMDKIGTGEGAQAYGHGLYFAENEGVARSYRDLQPASGIAATDGAGWEARAAFDAARGDVKKAVQKLQERRKITLDAAAFLEDGGKKNLAEIDEAIRRIEAGELAKGSMYEVRINANPDDFLDWDKPLSEQPAWKKIARSWGGEAEAAERLGFDPDAATGRQYLDAVAPQGAGEAFRGVSRRLAEEGIPGIKYLDAGSRGAGDGSRNYVVFDENLIEIVRKYGIAGAAAMLGVSAADLQASMQPQSMRDVLQ